MALREDIRRWRAAEAKKMQTPAFCVFSDRVLDAIVLTMPTTKVAFGALPGIGTEKREKFAAGVCAIVVNHAANRKNDAAPRLTALPGEKRAVSATSMAFFRNEATKRPRGVHGSVPPPQEVEPPRLDELSEEQRRAADKAVVERKNIFLSGSAGTGKSFLLKYCVAELKKIVGDDAVAVTAPTGAAAQQIGGVTLHSWSGVGLANGSPASVVARAVRSGPANERWRAAAVLVIDEVSMLDSVLFGALDAIGRAIRSDARHRPFGGLQVLCVGDFFQLPPVGLGTNDRGFAFESPAWALAGLFGEGFVCLRKVVRQDDEVFVRVLNDLRVGTLSAEANRVLVACHVGHKPLPPNDDIVPTKLYCTNRNVDGENSRQLARLAAKTVRVEARDVWRGTPNADDRKKCLALAEKTAPTALDLKVGAQVVVTKNMPDLGLVNGSRGKVVAFDAVKVVERNTPLGDFPCPCIRLVDGRTVRVPAVSTFFGSGGSGGSAGSAPALVRSQLPVKLAWSLTVHKSQGATLTRVEVQLADAFDYGQSYVALSRAVSLDGLWLRGPPLSAAAVKAHPKVKEFYESADRRDGDGDDDDANANANAPPTADRATATAASQHKKQLTADQLHRIEKNKRRALEKKRQRESATKLSASS